MFLELTKIDSILRVLESKDKRDTIILCKNNDLNFLSFKVAIRYLFLKKDREDKYAAAFIGRKNENQF